MHKISCEDDCFMDRMTAVQTNGLMELEQWRDNAHQLIDRMFEERKERIEKLVDQERNQSESISKNASSIVRSLEEQIQQFIPSPLLLPDQQKSYRKTPSLSSSANRSIKLTEPLLSIAAGDNSILVISDNNLCLFDQNLVMIKQHPWIPNDVYDILWSTTLGQYLLITPGEIFLFDPNRLSVESFPLGANSIISDWLCGTCFNNRFILSTRSRSPSIYEYILVPSIEFHREYSPPISCQHDQFILDLSSNNNTLIGILTKNLQNFIHLDLCSSNTFERYWSNRLETLSGRYRIRTCSLNDDQWLIINRNRSELLHLSPDGKLLRNEIDDPSPCHAALLQNGALAILTTESIHLHQLAL